VYLGWNLTTKYIAFAKTYSTTAQKLGGGSKVFQGRSKGESVNAAKNWVDMQVSVQIDPAKQRVVDIAKEKAAKEAVSVTDLQIKEQKYLNEELAKRNTFTETPKTTLLPSTDPSDVAQFNREKARQEAAAAFRPVRMPKDFIAGSYTVRASYNAITQTYVVNVFQGTVSKANATFDKNSGTAAAAKHNQWASLATKKAKYDTEGNKTYTKGGVTVELKVTKVASLGGFLDDLLNGFGKLVNGGAPVQDTGNPNRGLVPKEINNRTQAWDNKIRIHDEVIKKTIPTQSTFSSWDAMPEKSYVVIANYGPMANQPMSRPTYEQALELYNEIVAGVDEYLRNKPIIRPVPPADGSGGDITDPKPAPPPAGMPLPPDATPIDPPFDYIIPPDIRPAPPTTPTPVYIVPKPTPPMQPVKPTPKPGSKTPILASYSPEVRKAFERSAWGTGLTAAQAKTVKTWTVVMPPPALLFNRSKRGRAAPLLKNAWIFDAPLNQPTLTYFKQQHAAGVIEIAVPNPEMQASVRPIPTPTPPITKPPTKPVVPIDPGLRPLPQPMPEPMPVEIEPPEQSENYDDLVNKIIVDDTPGRIVVPQPISTYQYMSVEDNPWAPKTTTQMTSSKVVDNKQLLGVGLIALAGMMYYRT
jgi:hypothetical protein